MHPAEDKKHQKTLESRNTVACCTSRQVLPRKLGPELTSAWKINIVALCISPSFLSSPLCFGLKPRSYFSRTQNSENALEMMLVLAFAAIHSKLSGMS